MRTCLLACACLAVWVLAAATMARATDAPQAVTEADPADALFVIRASDGYGYIRRDGSVAIEPRLEWAGDFHEGRARFRTGRRYGMIDATGKEVAPAGWEWMGDMVNGRVVVRRMNLYGVIDGGGKVIVEPQYENIEPFYGNLAAFRAEKRWGFLGRDGKVAIPATFGITVSFNDGRALAKKPGAKSAYGYLNEKGEWVIEPAFFWVSVFSEGAAFVNDGYGKPYRCIGVDGQPLFEKTYGATLPFREGLAAVKEKYHWGFVDKSGKLVIEMAYHEVDGFHEGLARVRAKDKPWGYINPKGEAVLAPAYEFATNFRHGLALVKKAGIWQYIDREGKTVWQAEAAAPAEPAQAAAKP